VVGEWLESVEVGVEVRRVNGGVVVVGSAVELLVCNEAVMILKVGWREAIGWVVLVLLMNVVVGEIEKVEEVG